MSLFLDDRSDSGNAMALPVTLLAHLGDAVFHLFERERQIFDTSNARQMHSRVNSRVNAEKQAELLEFLTQYLTERELDLVRRARNVKASNMKRAVQNVSRKATAFEALLGFLYLEDQDRLKHILSLTTSIE